MVPGLYAIETLVQCNQGEILAALRSAVLVVFVVLISGVMPSSESSGMGFVRMRAQPQLSDCAP